MVKSVKKYWVESDDPIVEDLQQEVEELYLEIDEQETKISDLRWMIKSQQKLINELRERVYSDMKSFDKHLELAREMLELLRDLAKMVEKLQLKTSPGKEISPVIDQPIEGITSDLLKDGVTLAKAESAVEIVSSST